MNTKRTSSLSTFGTETRGTSVSHSSSTCASVLNAQSGLRAATKICVWCSLLLFLILCRSTHILSSARRRQQRDNALVLPTSNQRQPRWRLGPFLLESPFAIQV